MRNLLVILVLAVAAYAGYRGYKQLKPPPQDYERGGDHSAHLLKSLPTTCRPAKAPVAASPEDKKVQSFALLNVKLYMPANQAVAAVASDRRFTRPPDAMPVACVADSIEDARQGVKRESDRPDKDWKCVGRISYGSEYNDQLRIDLVEDLPEQPSCMVVNRVTYSRHGAKTDDASIQSWLEGLSKIYGPLDKFGSSWGTYTGAQMLANFSPEVLTLDLQDAGFGKSEDDIRAKMVEAARPQPKKKPKF